MVREFGTDLGLANVAIHELNGGFHWDVSPNEMIYDPHLLSLGLRVPLFMDHAAWEECGAFVFRVSGLSGDFVFP